MRQILEFRDIPSENPNKEVWKQLRFFRDVLFTCDLISNFHGKPNSENEKKNHRKQAKEISYCVRQAEQYFQASLNVDLATRPVLLYYGAVSLSKALVLLVRDGKSSFDYLRKYDRHKHHGLELKGDFENNSSDNQIDAFLNLLKCVCYTKKETNPKFLENDNDFVIAENKIAWGNFPMFYHSLISGAYIVSIKSFDKSIGESSILLQECVNICCGKMDLKNLASFSEINSLELVKHLPDMYFLNKQFGIEPYLLRGHLSIIELIDYKRKSNSSTKKIDNIQMKHDFFITEIREEQKNEIFRFFSDQAKKDNRLITKDDTHDYGSSMLLSTSKIILPEDNQTNIMNFYPDIVDDINGNLFYIVEPDKYIPETAALFMLLFNLGMLCRYHPDIWMKTLDKNIQIYEYIDTLLNVFYRKFPNLILDQLTGIKYYIHL